MTIAKSGVEGAKVSQVPLLDIGRGNAPLKEEFMAAFESVLDSGRFLFGPDVFQLEESCAAASQTKFGIGCASGSDALLLSMMALDIGPGDEVLVPSFTFFATASCVWRLGAKPVFVDIEPTSFNIDPARIQEQITPNTKAIIPVHLFGQCADMAAINKIAQMHNIPVIEDAAQAILSEQNGHRAGSMSLAGCISFYPTKNLGGMGDGGMLVTSDEAFAAKLKLLRGHGMEPRYYHQVVGINSRLDTLQAAALNVKMKHMAEWTEMRRQNALRYHQLFGQCGLDLVLKLPTELPGYHHVWNQYTVRVPRGGRDSLRKHLADLKVGSEIYYPVPLHKQQCFASLKEELAPLPETDKAAEEVLALPIFPELTEAEQRLVVSSIAQYYGIEANIDATPQRKSA
ncbi:aminotransferase class V-fold PLP-dependent enzyme [bacterium]|nr:aminotransferase class V-fold PLP-dependent enzyme [bacterium]